MSERGEDLLYGNHSAGSDKETEALYVPGNRTAAQRRWRILVMLLPCDFLYRSRNSDTVLTLDTFTSDVEGTFKSSGTIPQTALREWTRLRGSGREQRLEVNKLRDKGSSGLHPSEEHVKAKYITTLHEVCPNLKAPRCSFSSLIFGGCITHPKNNN